MFSMRMNAIAHSVYSEMLMPIYLQVIYQWSFVQWLG